MRTKFESAEKAFDDASWYDQYSGGEIEHLGYRVEKLERFVKYLMVKQVVTADQWNDFLGWESYEGEEKPCKN